MSSTTNAKPSPETPLWRRTTLFMRLTHIYVTLAALLVLLFFAATGFLLNHEDWFGLEVITAREVTFTVPPTLTSETQSLMLVETLRAAHDARGELKSLKADEGEVHLQFISPGRKSDFTIDRATGAGNALHETRGLLTQLTDLHRGKGTGTLWRRLLDLTAIALVIASVSGIVLWLSVPKRRRAGLVTIGVSVAIFAALWLVAVLR